MIEQFVRDVLAEDVGRGDLYARVSAPVAASAKIIAKSNGVLAGEEYLRVLATAERFGITWHK
ncbi:MAG TPA: nicotinate-nucleotide diphosphorylase (carboxylating), partial [Sulfuricurvum sp.]|nr:nicotinate-nucleotide diphosphorylase (carboxylating) [Sulfuricurvum sp.]